MRKSFIILMAVSLLFLPNITFGSVDELRQSLELITSGLDDQAGIEVVSLNKKEKLYSKNSNVLLNPASTTKLITAAAALKYLGPGYQFHTKFYLTHGDDLYVYGEGDPSFFIEEMNLVVRDLTSRGLTHVRNIIVNDSYFDGYTSPTLGGSKSRYDFYTGALSLNSNRIVVKVAPGRNVGDPAVVTADAGNVSIEITNNVVTKARRTRTQLRFVPPTKDGEEHFIVSGQIAVASGVKTYEYHVGLPPLYFAETLKALLKQNGCRIVGGIYRGPKPNESSLILDHASKPLSEIVKDMNKFSNNFIAEQLVKTLGSRFYAIPGSTQKGVEILKKYLADLGIRQSEYSLVNGSGLTYENRMSAEVLVKVIQDMYLSQKLWPYFEESLSVAGIDGTLRRRHKRDALCEKLRAKTGTLDNVKTIAGTIPVGEDEIVAFAVLLNGPRNMPKSVQVQDQIAAALANFKR